MFDIQKNILPPNSQTITTFINSSLFIINIEKYYHADLVFYPFVTSDFLGLEIRYLYLYKLCPLNTCNIGLLYGFEGFLIL